jgi:hypothetical protein
MFGPSQSFLKNRPSMNQTITNHSQTLRATGKTTTELLDSIRHYWEGSSEEMLCTEILTTELPEEIQSKVSELACLCLTVPYQLDESAELLKGDDFKMYNDVDHDKKRCYTFLIVGGDRFEISCSPIYAYLQTLKAQLPIVFLHRNSWSFVGYAWDRDAMDERLHTQLFGSDNYRYVPKQEHIEAEIWRTERLRPDFVAKIRPDRYGHIGNVRDMYAAVTPLRSSFDDGVAL